MVENWPVKVLSVALALVLFVFHQLNTLATRSLSVPLSVETNSALVPANDYPQNVRISLRGEDDSIKLISDGDIEAYVDLARHEEEGVYSVPVLVRKKGSALGIEPLEITVYPSKISILLDYRMNKIIPLSAVIRGRAADGFDLVSFSISPTEVAVTGPLSALEQIAEIETELIDLDGRNGDFTVEVNIINPNPFFVLRGSGKAEFSCVIRPSVSVRSIEGIPITLVGLDPALVADMGGRMGSVRIGGDQLRLDNFTPAEDFLVVDCTGIRGPGSFTVPVTLNLPQDFSLIRRDPEELNLTVVIKENNF
jgi:YbbR domain-containing protein